MVTREGFGVSIVGLVAYRSILSAILPFAKGSYIQRMSIRAAATLSAGIITFPLDTVRRKMILACDNKNLRYSSATSCLQHVYESDGLGKYKMTICVPFSFSM
eukprot:m.151107 g.151107  ORF g.151107 m.151107 type:complete len:103 (+) comp15035_c0_seq4:704-1012(+)